MGRPLTPSTRPGGLGEGLSEATKIGSRLARLPSLLAGDSGEQRSLQMQLSHRRIHYALRFLEPLNAALCPLAQIVGLPSSVNAGVDSGPGTWGTHITHSISVS